MRKFNISLHVLVNDQLINVVFPSSAIFNSKIQRFRQRKWCFICPIANKREISQSVSHEMKEEIVSFYEDDEIFRIMPGKKDYVSTGRNIHKQKRLLLVNLKGLHSIFKSKYPPRQIGFSKFSVYASSGVFFLFHLEHILFVFALITKT